LTVPVGPGAAVAGTGRVLVGADDAGVHADDPLDLADGVVLGLGVGQQPVPGPVTLPPSEPVVAGLPGTVRSGRSRQGAPVRSFHKIPLMTRR
jgi:hypothetical protein